MATTKSNDGFTEAQGAAIIRAHVRGMKTSALLAVMIDPGALLRLVLGDDAVKAMMIRKIGPSRVEADACAIAAQACFDEIDRRMPLPVPS